MSVFYWLLVGALQGCGGNLRINSMNDQDNECNGGWTLSKMIFFQVTTLLLSGNLCSLVWYLDKINHSDRVSN